MSPNVTKISHISPYTVSPRQNPLTIPLTFFDLKWLSFYPTQQVIFYKLSDSSRMSFYSVILPKLEQSLAVVLGYFLPLTGHLTWNPQDPKPCIVVLPQDTVLLKVAESRDAEFSNVSGKGLRPAKEIRPFVPVLPVSGDSPSLLSVQVTFFPNQGFSIGIISHHVFMDGITAQVFIKAWAHICKHGTMDLPEDLTPFLDRSAIDLPPGLDAKMLEYFPSLFVDKANARTLKLPPTEETEDDLFRVTLEMSARNVKRLKEQANNESTRSHLELHLSTFVVVNAYLWTCLVKTRGGDGERQVAYEYAADFRSRLSSSVPKTYAGACVFTISCLGYKAKTFMGEDGFINAVGILSDSVKGLESRGIEEFHDSFVDRTKNLKQGTQIWAVAGSNRFSVYGADFGWGRPVNSEIVFIDQCPILALSERRDEAGGVEIGLSLKKSEMDVFISLFKNGFEN